MADLRHRVDRADHDVGGRDHRLIRIGDHSSSLHTQINWATWTVTAYELGLVVWMPISGRISDQLGRKEVFLVAAVVFVTASFLCDRARNLASAPSAGRG